MTSIGSGSAYPLPCSSKLPATNASPVPKIHFLKSTAVERTSSVCPAIQVHAWEMACAAYNAQYASRLSNPPRAWERVFLWQDWRCTQKASGRPGIRNTRLEMLAQPCGVETPRSLFFEACPGTLRCSAANRARLH